ncbi:NAD(P)-binding domain-containing protein [Streptomyces sp. DG2A-72]|uniref:NAD(P)-dependent oxidoreductase n=1 Tax=Streptomyces sp. DG2A-72 TaxID=3051386 RepID=UPI00265B9881|nr:NAD(P)-binding domain-containing protein [Streptomyces sp. DG2A-72]MDO0939332.1 NAD(P)-binding domain-containing protein [Streptomyces sp. DG2A-72]
MADEQQSPVTVIGLGLMGQALAATFLDHGYPTIVWNRTPHKADALVARGAVQADTPAAAITASRLILVCVTDYDTVGELLSGLTGDLAGRVLVNVTSGTSDRARATAEWAAEHGIQYIDGAVMATPPVIGTPHAAFLYSGATQAYRDHESALKVLGGGTVHLGEDAGLAALYDVALLGIMWGTLNSFLQGAALLETAGVSATQFEPFATNWIQAVTGFVSSYAEQVDEGRYPAHDATVDTHLATMRYLLHESRTLGVHSDLPYFVKELADRAVAEGHAKDSYASLIEIFRKPSS